MNTINDNEIYQQECYDYIDPFDVEMQGDYDHYTLRQLTPEEIAELPF